MRDPRNDNSYESSYERREDRTMYRTRNWKRARQRQIRIRLLTAVAAFLLISGAALSHYLISNAQTADAKLSFKYYTSIEVAEGETLWSIAECHADAHYADIRDYVDEVVRINHLWDEDRLLAGQHLIIPYYSEEYKK